LEVRDSDGNLDSVGNCNSTGRDQLHGVKKEKTDVRKDTGLFA
jgi:hypothetical protein